MNADRQMIIVKGEIKTQEIRSCTYNPNTQKWNVIYNNGAAYPYSKSNVEYLKDPVVLSPDMYHISREGKEFFDVREISVFHGQRESYWHICFGDGSERDYKQSELEIAESCLKEGNAKDVFEYLKKIACLSEVSNPETGEKILPKRYENINFVDKKRVLAQYLNPREKGDVRHEECIPIFPFGCNKSQYKAVKNALENQISVIQGPPGTGKTQTILNIIANILMQGKTVQIVSNNNAAIDNVYEKLSSPKYNLDFIAAPLGNFQNKKNFIQRQSSAYPDFSSWRLSDMTIHLENIKEKSRKLQTIFEKQEELARLKQELAGLEVEFRHFAKYLQDNQIDLNAVRMKKKVTSQKLMDLWQEYQLLADDQKKISLLFKIKSIFLYGIADWSFYKQDSAKNLASFQGLFYKYKIEELKSRIQETEEYLHNGDENLLNEMCGQSMMLLKDTLARRYGGKEKRKVFTEEDLWRNSDEVLKEYPVVLSTTFSSRTSLGNDAAYDYLIMDEASQVDIATGALALSCAQNAVIVGDTKQLPNVVTEEIKEQSNEIFDSFHINSGYQFTKSFLQSILEILPDAAETLLREHYRCHPKIINFCNQKFYRGELIIMTEDKGENDVLSVVKTAVGNHVRDHYSQRQIDVIRKEIIPNYVKDPDETGIIAPYKNQVKALENEFTDIDAATVHKFQGREKDTIIISTVDDEITDFADDPYLLNVAVSRAKKKLILVVSGNEQSPERNISDLIAYIQYHNFEVQESKVYSIFDYLYKQYTEARLDFLKRHKRISEYDSENLMYGLICDILKENIYASLDVVCHFPLHMLIQDCKLLDERECAYAMNPATHLDFVIYNRISKKTVLAVEVDGYMFHKKGTDQAERDMLKNHILDVYGIPFVRFCTNGSEEREVLIKKLRESMGDESISMTR